MEPKVVASEPSVATGTPSMVRPTLRRVLSCEPTFDRIVALLEATFIDDEQRTTEQLRTLCDSSPLFGLHAVEVDGQFAGMVSTWNFGKHLYIEHLAIEERLRGQGLGTLVMRQVCQLSGLPMILEIDLPSLSEEAGRRAAFYGRLGFQAWSTPYEQPPYGPGKSAVRMVLMSRGLEETPECVSIVTALLRRHVYGIKDKPEGDKPEGDKHEENKP